MKINTPHNSRKQAQSMQIKKEATLEVLLLEGGKRSGQARGRLELAQRREVFANVLRAGCHIKQGICP